MVTASTARTAIKDALLANVSPGLDADEVSAVEWAAMDDTLAAVRSPEPRLVDFETYRRVGR